MDCVTCEKCKVWGKLQILGLGTAIKILLSSDQDLEESNNDGNKFLNRQEIISLINTLHQLAKSVEFASRASELELNQKLASFGSIMLSVFIVFVMTCSLIFIQRWRRY